MDGKPNVEIKLTLQVSPAQVEWTGLHLVCRVLEIDFTGLYITALR